MTRINSFHPNSLYLNNQDKNFDSYFEEIKRKYPKKDYILRIENDDTNMFLDYGFIECRRTYDLSIDINNLSNYLAKDTVNEEQKSRHDFVLSDKLIIKWYEKYKKTHKVNPVKDFNLEEFKEVLNEDLDTENSIVILDRNSEIIAYSLMYSDSENTKEIGYVYFDNNISKIELLKAISTRLLYLKNTGIKTIMIEVDNTDKYEYEMFSTYIDNNTSFMKTLIYKKEMNQFSTKAIEYDDVNYVLKWSKDIQFCIVNDWPLDRSKKEIIAWWKSVIKLQSDIFQRIMIISSGIVIGYFDLYTHDEDTIELGIAIGDKDYRNKGYGSLLFSKITNELRKQYPCKDIIAITDNTNVASQRMLIKSGYILINNKQLNAYVEHNELLYQFI